MSGRFHYQIEAPTGETQEGELFAASRAVAERALAATGAQVKALRELPAEAVAVEAALNSADSEELLQRLSDLGRSGLPLASGLRAMAEENQGGRLAGVFRRLAAQLEAGVPLDEALADKGIPAHVKGLVTAASTTGRLGKALYELVEHRRRLRDLKRVVAQALSYPLIVLVLAAAVFVAMIELLVPPFRDMFRDFELQLPPPTAMVIWWQEYGVPLVGIGLGAVIVAFVCCRLFLPAVAWRLLLNGIPMVGVFWHWIGVAEWSRLLGLLLQQGMPLPEALRLTAAGLSDASLAEVSRRLANRIEKGASLADALWQERLIPTTVIPLVRAGQSSTQLPETLAAISDLFTERVQMRASLLRSVGPPLVFVTITFTTLAILPALFLPLVSLIQGLT